MNRFRRRIRDSSGGPTTFIAPTTRIVGNIDGKGPYIFCGTVEGDCDIDGALTLADGGRWIGTLKATDIVVAGRVDGDVIARQRVEIAASAHVNGSLSGHSIAVAEGAVIEGDIKVTNGKEATTFQEKRQSENADGKQPPEASDRERQAGLADAQDPSKPADGERGQGTALAAGKGAGNAESEAETSASAVGRHFTLLGKREAEAPAGRADAPDNEAGSAPSAEPHRGILR